MDYDSDFLKECRDERLRKRLWVLFQRAEEEARTFCDSGNCWIRILKVVECANASWSPDGTIKIPVSCGNLGVIFHEVFHSAFHQSPLWHVRCNGNDQWGNAFCDAFRYFMDDLHLSDSEDTKFFPDFKSKMTKPTKDIVIVGDRYQGWASRIVLKACEIAGARDMPEYSEYDAFKQLWRERNADPNEPLTKYFGLA